MQSSLLFLLRVCFFLWMTDKQRTLAENVTTFTFTEFAEGIKWHRTVDNFCYICKPDGPGQDGKGMGCQEPYEIHQEQMPVLALGMTWSGTTPGGELGREGSKGVLLYTRLGMGQQGGLEAKRQRASGAGLAWSGGAEEWFPSSHWSLGCQFCDPLLNKDID